MTKNTLSSRRLAGAAALTIAAAGTVTAATVAARSPQPDDIPNDRAVATPATQPIPSEIARPDHEPTPIPEAAADHAPRRQELGEVDDDELHAARERAEAWVTEYLTWQHDENPADRIGRLETHLTGHQADELDPGHGIAEEEHRRDVEWSSTGEIEHSYVETATPDFVVVVVIATEHITTIHHDDERQTSQTVQLVPTEEGWRVDGMVF